MVLVSSCHGDNIFSQLSQNELENVDGGSWLKIGAAVLGGVLIGHSLVIGVVAGIGGSVVGTPVVGVCTGIAATASTIAVGAELLDYACS